MKIKSLKHKNILITAGPTWVAIDRVRVISNVASGETGRLLAQEADKMGARVTLLLGPVGEFSVPRGVRVIRFNYFNELLSLIRRELSQRRYHAVVHSAAVSDYRPKSALKGKIDSGRKDFDLELSPTLRIIDRIKKIRKDLFLVAFKLEFGLTQPQLIKEARKLSKRSGADLVAVNTFAKKRYSARITDSRGRILARADSKKKMARKLLGILKVKL